MTQVLDISLRTLHQNAGTQVTQITLNVGVLSGFLPDYMEKFFRMIAQKTPARDAKLIIEAEPAVFSCTQCAHESTFLQYGEDFICQSCGSNLLSLLSGHTFQVESVAIK